MSDDQLLGAGRKYKVYEGMVIDAGVLRYNV